MHEASLAQGLLRTALDAVRVHNSAHPEKPAGRITSIRVSVGLLSCVEISTFTACFELLCEGTQAADARLVVDIEPLTCDCRDCGARLSLTSRRFCCPHCQSLNLTPHGGHGLTLLSLDVEQKD